MRACSFVIVAISILGGGPAYGQQIFDYHAVDVPCAAGAPTFCADGVAPQTAVNGINAAGDIVGTYTDGAKHQHGFVMKNGRYTTLDVPGSFGGVQGTLPTAANGINPAGDIVGTYTAPFNDAVPFDSPLYCPTARPAACVKGFIYRRGEFDRLLFPGHPGAVPQRITPNGDVYGCLHDLDTGMSMYGAVWYHDGAVANLMAGGGEVADSTMDMAMSMNNGATPGGRVIVGLFNDAVRRHGFVVQDGVFYPYDVPSATIKLTAIWDMNPSGQFVGTFVDGTGRHGFLQNPDGSAPVQVDVTGHTNTTVLGINPGGVIVGTYTIGSATHGFVGLPIQDEQ
jgi:probable HAF family extracellular repeat protein